MSELTDRPITAAQVRSIKIAQRRAGMEDGEYRTLLFERYGVESSKRLTRRQASELLTRLGRPLPRPPGTGRPRAPRPDRLPGGATRLATRAQRELIAELAGEILWASPHGYAEWLRSSLGIERVATSAQAGKVIEGLKAMRRRGDGE